MYYKSVDFFLRSEHWHNGNLGEKKDCNLFAHTLHSRNWQVQAFYNPLTSLSPLDLLGIIHLSASAIWTEDQSRHVYSWHPQLQRAHQHPRSWFGNTKLYFLSFLSQINHTASFSKPLCFTSSSHISSVTFWEICLTAPWYVLNSSGKQMSSRAVWGFR